MGVIRWEEDADGKWQGHLGWSHVATAGCYAAPDGSDVFALTVREEFPGSVSFVSPDESIGDCKDAADDMLQEWLDDAGLMPKPFHHEPPLPAWFGWLHRKDRGLPRLRSRLPWNGILGSARASGIPRRADHGQHCGHIRHQGRSNPECAAAL